MLPTITEVVLVKKAILRAAKDIVEHGPSFALPFQAELGIGRSVLDSAFQEQVKMAVVPPHHSLEDMMKALQARVARDLHTPPDRRLRAAKGDLDLENGARLRHRQAAHAGERALPSSADAIHSASRTADPEPLPME